MGTPDCRSFSPGDKSVVSVVRLLASGGGGHSLLLTRLLTHRQVLQDQQGPGDDQALFCLLEDHSMRLRDSN